MSVSPRSLKSTSTRSPALSLGPHSGGGDLAFIDEAMGEARRNWNVMFQDDFNPISVALEMLNENNPTYDHRAFCRLLEKLDRGMEVIVESKKANSLLEYHGAFNEAVGTFANIVEHIHEAHKAVAGVRGGLEEFREQIGYRREDLPRLWTQIEEAKLQNQRKLRGDEARRLRSQVKQQSDLVVAYGNLQEASRMAQEAGEDFMALQIKGEARQMLEDQMLPALLVTLSLNNQDDLESLQAWLPLFPPNPLLPVVQSAKQRLLANLAMDLVRAEPELLSLLLERLPTELDHLISRHWQRLSSKQAEDTIEVEWLDALPMGRGERLEFAVSIGPVGREVERLFGHLLVIAQAIQHLGGDPEPFMVGACRSIINAMCATDQAGATMSSTEALRAAQAKQQLMPIPCLFVPTRTSIVPEGVPMLAQKQLTLNSYQSNISFPFAPNPFYALLLAKPMSTLSQVVPQVEPLLADWLKGQVIPRLESSLLTRISQAFTLPTECCAWFYREYGWMQRLLAQIPPSVQSEMTALIRMVPTQFIERVRRLIGEINSVRDEDVNSVFSAQLAANSDLRDCLARHSTLVQQADLQYDLVLGEKEALLIDQLKRDRSLHRREVIFDRKALVTLTGLQKSLEQLHADLISTTADDFHEMLRQTIQSLSLGLLCQLRLEVRCHVLYYLDLAYREGNYCLEESVDEPDGYVACLANDLINLEALIRDSLPYARYQ